MWIEEYQMLNDWEKGEFTRIANLLLSKTFILRYKFNSKEKLSKANYDYTFLERHFIVFSEYFKLSGWEMKPSSNYGVIGLYNRYEMNHVKLNKDTTYILYVIRLIYDEEREKLSLSQNIFVTIDDVIEKMKNINLIEKKPSDKVLHDSFALLRNHNIIDKIEGEWNEPGTQILIYPSILFILPDDKVNDVYEFAKYSINEEIDNDELLAKEVEI